MDQRRILLVHPTRRDAQEPPTWSPSGSSRPVSNQWRWLRTCTVRRWGTVMPSDGGPGRPGSRLQTHYHPWAASGSILRGAEVVPRHGGADPGNQPRTRGLSGRGRPRDRHHGGSDRGRGLPRRGATGAPGARLRGGEQVFLLGPQRGDRREGLARAHDRADRRDRRSSPSPPGAATASSWRRPPAPRHTRSRPVAPSCGRTSETLLLVPISAHALFARPVVVGPASRLAVEILPHVDAQGVVWCDGRRAVDLPEWRADPKSRGRSSRSAWLAFGRSLHRPTGRQSFIWTSTVGGVVLGTDPDAERHRHHRPRGHRPRAVWTSIVASPS